MKKLFYFVTAAVLLFTAAAFVSPQYSTSKCDKVPDQLSIFGKVTEAASGEPLFSASITLHSNGKYLGGMVTDFDGNYVFKNLAPGNYEVEVTHVGFATQKITDIKLTTGKPVQLDIKMVQGVTLESVVITGHKVPLVEQDNVTYGRVVTADQIKNSEALRGSVTGVKVKKNKLSRAERKRAKEASRPIPAPAVKIRGSRSVTTHSTKDDKSDRTSTPADVKAKEEKLPTPGNPAAKPGPPEPKLAVADEAKVKDKNKATDAIKVHKDSIMDYSAEVYEEIYENPFLEVKKTPLSTFSIDVDAASYSNMRRFLNNGSSPPKDAIRIEEMINYFNYDYPEPKGEHPFEIITEISECPWQKGHKLLHIGLQGERIAKEDLPASNLVFLIDVSGSMNSSNKLPLLQQSMNLLVDNLRQKDFVSIVVYAGSAGVVLNPTNGANKMAIKNAINRLRAGGSTAGGAGIKLAYNLARENFVKNGNNRVILATDGDFNVGISSDINLVKLIEEERKSGVFLTVLGFGMGNYQDGKMQKLANKGNGNHAYIDNLGEAQKVLINEFGGTMFAIAKDVKLQLEFNPDQVKGYRLIGYENRLLADEDFDDDTKDAGEMGAGHTVTALYEIIPANYQTPYIADVQDTEQMVQPVKAFSGHKADMVHIKFRYKKPDGHKSKLLEKGAADMNIPLEKSSDNFRWSASVAEFGLLLRDSKYRGKSNWRSLKNMAEKSKGKDANGYRAEMILLIDQAQKLEKKTLAGK